MTTDRRRCALFGLSALTLVGCAVKPPPDPRELDCATLDRAAERFPEECGEAATDAEVGEDATVEQDAAAADAGL